MRKFAWLVPAVAAAITAPSYAATLIHHWTFDEASGLTAGDSAGDNDGSLIGFEDNDDSQWVSGRIGGALDLTTDATINNSVNTGTGLTPVTIAGGYSVSAWVNLDTIGAGERNIFSTQNSGVAEVNLGHVDSGALSSWTGTFDTAGAVPTGQWAHVAMTNSTADGKRLYINGTQVGFNGAAGSNAWDGAVDSQIGAFFDGFSRYVEGSVDDVSLWDGVLTATEIERINTFGRTNLAAPAAAAVPLLAYEGFDYVAGDGNASAQSGGVGWASGSSWAGVENGDPNNDDIIGGSLTPSGDSAGLITKGGHLFQTSQNRVGRALDTSNGGAFDSAGLLDGNGDIGADGTTVYIGFLQQANPTDLFWEFELHRDNLGDPGRIAGLGNDQGGTSLHLRTPATGANNPVGAADTDVNFYVLKIDFGAGDNDTISLFINPELGVEPAFADFVTVNAGNLAFDGISFGMFVDGTVAHDEVRIGTTYFAVTPTIPTPAALPAGLAMIGLVAARRRRR